MMTGMEIAAKAHKNRGYTKVITHKNSNLTGEVQTAGTFFSERYIQRFTGVLFAWIFCIFTYSSQML
jgi:hypothetical protein